jgi:hypothetical protein
VLAYIYLVRWLPIHTEPSLPPEPETRPAGKLAQAVS